MSGTTYFLDAFGVSVTVTPAADSIMAPGTPPIQVELPSIHFITAADARRFASALIDAAVFVEEGRNV